MSKASPIGLASVALTAGTFWTSLAQAEPVAIDAAAMPRLATVDERFQSYNIEMARVIGAEFWKPYAEIRRGQRSEIFEKRPPIDLRNSRLRILAAALGPAYVRVSGTWANSVYIADSDDAATRPPPSGFTGVLTPGEWAGVVDFSHLANAELVTSFAVSEGVRDTSGTWSPGQAQRLLAYTRSVGGSIAAAEFFNEPNLAAEGGAPRGYGAADYARDFARFRSFARDNAPEMLIVGPGSVAEGVAIMNRPLLNTADLLAAQPRPRFDVFSYHSYAAVSERCATLGEGVGTSETAALSDAWLARTDRILSFYENLRDRFQPSRPIWVTETADAACGGNPWAATFLDSFRYLDQLGRLAKRGVQVVFHNTLASSDYGLIDRETLQPRPNYWAALLWRRLMGRAVLDAGSSPAGLNLYAHCLRDAHGGVALLAINLDRSQSRSIRIPLPADRYTLTARTLDDRRVQLNGHDLVLRAGGQLPPIEGEHVSAGPVELAPASITFLAIASAANRSCL